MEHWWFHSSSLKFGSSGRIAPRGGSPQDILNVRLGVPNRQSGCLGEEKNLLSLPEIESKFCGRQLIAQFFI